MNHQGQVPSVTISFNLAPGVSLGQATQAIENAERTIGFPPTIQASFQGTAAAFQDSLSSEPILILTALVTVYIVLGMLYESYIHPITILSTMPSAGVGALLALLADAQRTERDWNDRHHPADWPGEEERHHDDRRGPRRGAHAGQEAGGGDLRCVHPAFPADHDDDHGGAAGRAAAGAGHGARDRNCTGRWESRLSAD